MSLKFTEEFCIMPLKNDAKFEEELTFCWKIYMRNFDPNQLLTRALESHKNVHFN